MTSPTHDLPLSARILITGGAGFIGTHLAERVCDRAEVVLFDNFRRDSLQPAPHLARLAPGARIEARPVARSDVRARIPAIDRAREVLGFEPCVELDEGLRRTLTRFDGRREGEASS